MSRKGENIYKRKDGRWEARFVKSRKTDGTVKYGYVYARTYREVRQKKEEEISSIYNCYGEAAIEENSSQNTFGMLAAQWLTAIRPQIKETTYNKYRNLLNSYILPKFREVPFSSLSHDTLTEFCNDLLTNGGKKSEGLSPKTVYDSLTIIKNVFHYAENSGYCIPFNIKGVTVRQQMKELTVISRTDQEKLSTYLYQNLSYQNFGILMCLYTGMRIGEVCGLHWNDISLTEKTVYIHNTLQRIQTPDDPEHRTKVVEQKPKSDCSIRTIPLPECIFQVILDHYQDAQGYVLTGQQHKYIEPRQMEIHFKRVLHETDIEEVKFHALRHTFATRCIEVGFDIKSLSEILGHATVNITMNRYVHPSMELKHKNMKKLSELFSVK